jgi:hypothetical protein
MDPLIGRCLATDRYRLALRVRELSLAEQARSSGQVKPDGKAA